MLRMANETSGSCSNCNHNFTKETEKICICETCFGSLKSLIAASEEEEKAFQPQSKMVLFLEMPHLNKKRRFLYQPKTLHKNIELNELCSKLIHRFASKDVRLPSNAKDVILEINDSIHKNEFITFENLHDLFDGCKIKMHLSPQYVKKMERRKEKRASIHSNSGDTPTSTSITVSMSNNANNKHGRRLSNLSQVSASLASDIIEPQTPIDNQTINISDLPNIESSTATDDNNKNSKNNNNSNNNNDNDGNKNRSRRSSSLESSPVLISMENVAAFNAENEENEKNNQNNNNDSSDNDGIMNQNFRFSHRKNTSSNSSNNSQENNKNKSQKNKENNNNNNPNDNNDDIDFFDSPTKGDNYVITSPADTTTPVTATGTGADTSAVDAIGADSTSSFGLNMTDILPIVVDNGSYSIKGGFGGKAQHADSLHGPQNTLRCAYYNGVIGEEAIEMACKENKHNLNFNIMENGTIKNFDAMTKLWNRLFKNLFNNDNSSNNINGSNNSIGKNKYNENNNDEIIDLNGHCVLMSERYHCPSKEKERSFEILFETFNSSKVFLSNPGTLAMYGSGKTTGIALDIGNQTSTIATIFEGATVNGKLICNHSGYELNKYIMKEYDISYINSDIIKTNCYSIPYSNEELMKNDNHLKKQEYILPDGTKLNIGIERLHAPLQLMFGTINKHNNENSSNKQNESGEKTTNHKNDNTNNDNHDNNNIHATNVAEKQSHSHSYSHSHSHSHSHGSQNKRHGRRYSKELNDLYGHIHDNNISHCVKECILGNNIQFQPILWKTIVIAGGTSELTGFAERFAKDIRNSTMSRTCVIATKNRKNKAWIGGSIVSMISTLNDLAIDRKMYDEMGSAVVRHMTL